MSDQITQTTSFNQYNFKAGTISSVEGNEYGLESRIMLFETYQSGSFVNKEIQVNDSMIQVAFKGLRL